MQYVHGSGDIMSKLQLCDISNISSKEVPAKYMEEVLLYHECSRTTFHRLAYQ